MQENVHRVADRRSRIPFNLWRADNWHNKPATARLRRSRHDYSYYFTTNISITTSGNFNTAALRFCTEQVGVDRCLFSIGVAFARGWVCMSNPSCRLSI